MKETDIITIVCIPKSEHMYHYFINGSKDPHSINPEKLKKYLLKFNLPEIIQKIHTYIKSYFAFIIDIDKITIKRLVANKDNQFAEFKLNHYKEQFSINKVLRDLNNENKKNDITNIDSFIKRIISH